MKKGGKSEKASAGARGRKKDREGICFFPANPTPPVPPPALASKPAASTEERAHTWKVTSGESEFAKYGIAASREEADRRRDFPPFGEIQWSVLNDEMLLVVERAGSRWLWENAAKLPETGFAVNSVRRAWRAVQAVPWPDLSSFDGALEATVCAMRLDWPLTRSEFGASPLDDTALFLVRHFNFPLGQLRGLMAAKAVQNDTHFFERLSAALRYSRGRGTAEPLRQAMVRCWLPLGLWLMDDANGVDVLADHYGNARWSAPAYKKARQWLKLYRHPAVPIRTAQRSVRFPNEWNLAIARSFKHLLCQAAQGNRDVLIAQILPR